MTVHIYAIQTGVSSASIDSNGIMTVNSDVTFLHRDGVTLTTEQATVPFTFNPASPLSAMNDAVTDAVVDYADFAFGWDLPRTHFIFHSFQKGLII